VGRIGRGLGKLFRRSVVAGGGGGGGGRRSVREEAAEATEQTETSEEETHRDKSSGAISSSAGGGGSSSLTVGSAPSPPEQNTMQPGVSGGSAAGGRTTTHHQREERPADLRGSLPRCFEPSVLSVMSRPGLPGQDPSLIFPPLLGSQSVVLPGYVQDDDEYHRLVRREDDYDEDDGYLEAEVVCELNTDEDLKVDKGETPDIESMLRRAARESDRRLEVIEEEVVCATAVPSGGEDLLSPDAPFVPLSEASLTNLQPEQIVYNDTLKICMVSAPCVDKSWLARKLRGSKRSGRGKRSCLAVDVRVSDWKPAPAGSSADQKQPPFKYSIWDIQGESFTEPGDCDFVNSLSNFGAHPGTQSLFFSAETLYILVWDVACKSPGTFQYEINFHGREDIDESDSDDESDEFRNGIVTEETNRRADLALRADISNRVLSWVDCIAGSGPRSAILPVALIPNDMAEHEVTRRCNMMQNLLEEHIRRYDMDPRAPKLLAGAENILCVEYDTGEGIEQVQETVMAIATDFSRSVFSHVGTPVPPGTVEVLESIRGFKKDHKLILLDHLLYEVGVGSLFDMDCIVNALHFLSSIGEILYFGTQEDDVLSRYIILSRRWLASSLSCILRNDWKEELIEARRFMNMQCLYSEASFVENDLTRTLVADPSSSCPLLSDEDARMMWQKWTFLTEAADCNAQVAESCTTAPSMYQFLERLLVHSGVFLPLRRTSSSEESRDRRSQVFFVPSLVAQLDPSETWTYKSSESWMTTLCHSWLFRDGAPSNLMEHVTRALLRDLYEFSMTFQGTPSRDASQERSVTAPVDKASVGSVIDDHHQQAIGRVKIRHIVCWKSTVLVKIGTIFADSDTGELRESFVELFVAVVDQSSDNSVASREMRASMQRVVVSGKGQVGHHGRKLWRGGYKKILDSVRNSLSVYSNVDAQVICPACLAQLDPRAACTWGWESVLAAAESGSSTVRCMRGHRVDSNLLCGRSTHPKPTPSVIDGQSQIRLSKPVCEMLPSVVLVGLWDSQNKVIRNVGSGFIADKKLGLVVTAGHVLFKMDAGPNFGVPYYGIAGAKAVIGVIPDDDDEDSDSHIAVFRYFADIVAHDIRNVDACVLSISSRMEHDVNDEGLGCAYQVAKRLTTSSIPNEELQALKLTSKFELDETVRILGFNQGGEGILEQGRHVNRFVDFARGYICKRFRLLSDVASESNGNGNGNGESSDSGSDVAAFKAHEEIVVMCSTISGHSGGPCVNRDGKVIGILSRVDPVDRQRCYLVPASAIDTLRTKARMLFSPSKRGIDPPSGDLTLRSVGSA
jgi:hypothetical protein